MIEITIRTEDEVALQRLLQFIKKIGLEISSPTRELVAQGVKINPKKTAPTPKKIPKIEWAKNPEKAQDFFGIWKDNPLNQPQLRNSSWRGRL